MKFIEKFFNTLGYVRAQTKPNSYPLNNKIPIHTPERDRVLEPQVENSLNVPVTTSPEQLSGDPRMPNPERDIQKLNEGGPVDLSPYNDQLADPSGLNHSDTQTNNINEMQLRTRPLLDLKDINKRPVMNIKEIKSINETLGTRMEKLGIVTVDKTVFMDRYNKMYLEASKIAVSKRLPISQVLEELIG